MRQLDVVIAMPAFNEESTLPRFVAEINEAFEGVFSHIVVHNDSSTDNTEKTIQPLARVYPLTLVTNSRNIGHGPTTIGALRTAADLDPKFVIAADGDGNIRGATLRALYENAARKKTPVIIEGVRTQRDGPWFRKLVSAATRVLVKFYSGKASQDANTPFRVYPKENLRDLLATIPSDHLTPNLLISALVRRESIPFEEVPVVLHRREGADPNGSTWKQRFRLLPSSRFLRFCVRATGQWVNPSRPGK